MGGRFKLVMREKVFDELPRHSPQNFGYHRRECAYTAHTGILPGDSKKKADAPRPREQKKIRSFTWNFMVQSACCFCHDLFSCYKMNHISYTFHSKNRKHTITFKKKKKKRFSLMSHTALCLSHHDPRC